MSTGYAHMFAIACAHCNLPEEQALQTYAWAWNQVLAAVKLIPLDQSAGQHLLDALVHLLDQLATQAVDIEDEDIESCVAMQVLVSARHETQYTGLFKS